MTPAAPAPRRPPPLPLTLQAQTRERGTQLRLPRSADTVARSARRRRDDICEGGVEGEGDEGQREREGRNARLRKSMSGGKQNNELAENVGKFPGSDILVFLVVSSSQNPELCLSGTSSKFSSETGE